jgi:hypothetical protein
MGRPSCRASFLGHPSARFLAPTAKTSYFLLFLPSGAVRSGPQRSRARSFWRGVSGPLTARTAAKPSLWEENSHCLTRSSHDEKESQ